MPFAPFGGHIFFFFFIPSTLLFFTSVFTTCSCVSARRVACVHHPTRYHSAELAKHQGQPGGLTLRKAGVLSDMSEDIRCIGLSYTQS